MRYLGNKVRLLEPIVQAARRVGFTRGTVCDLFAGTAVVGRAFRAAGCRVLGNDVMACSAVQQRVALELSGPPSFETLRHHLDLPSPGPATGEGPLFEVDHPGLERSESWEPARRVAAYLVSLPDACGLVSRQYAPGAGGDRRFFTEENGGRLDAWVAELRDWHTRGWLDPGELAFLTAAVVDAADRVANISGTYGAYLKEWQQNALKPAVLRLPVPGEGPRGEAHQGDAFEWLPEVEADLLYLDPPYNNRQYSANYHVLEALARFPTAPDPAALEASLYGKTGLLPGHRSVLCSRHGTRCRDAFRQLLLATRIPRVVISYNEEGIVSREEFEEILAEYAGVAPSRLEECLTVHSYRRFRSDRDGRVSREGIERNYHEVPGRRPGEVHEWLFHVARTGRRA